MTAFLYFVQRCQKDFKVANPTLIHKQVIAKMGEAWHTMTEKDKKTFADLAATDKIRYEKEKAEYLKKAVIKKKEVPAGKTTTEKKAKVNVNDKLFLNKIDHF